VVVEFSTTFASFNDKLNAGDLTCAEALMGDGSKFAKIMKRACLFAAIGTQGTVPLQ